MELQIEVDILDEDRMEALKSSASDLLRKLIPDRKSGEIWSFRDVVWPAWEPSTVPSLVLVPLDRLGAAQGFSGTHVMIGYFIDTREDGTSFPSKPMVVKNYLHDSTSTYHKLEDENARGDSVKDFVAYHKDSFAIPIHFNKSGDLSFLWSPFASSKWVFETVSKSSRLSLSTSDFLGLLRERTEIVRLKEIISIVFQLLMPLHVLNGRASAQKVDILKHYKWYLRDIDPTSDWGSDWAKRTWGPKTQRKVKDLDREWTNPFWVLEKLRSLKPQLLYCGATHGDLHPRNIVFTDFGIPHIIDFGWSGVDSHIAKDFALLECNLRFVTLQTSLGSEDLLKLANWISFGETPPTLKSRYGNETIELITHLRKTAEDHFRDPNDWDLEYILPMFLISFGLLKHIQQYDNQIATRYTVLSLADYVARHILPKKGKKGAI